MFDDAVADELIPHSPWVLPSKLLPRREDKDPGWRETAKFTKDELRLILWAPDELVPWDRRVCYALFFLGGMRFGEASARTWRDRLDTEPLNALRIHNQFHTKKGALAPLKTRGVRKMPEHPTLARILDEWRVYGWPLFYGRTPSEDDLIVPSAKGGHRRSNHMGDFLTEDLKRLALRPRRQHDFRRSFIGHAVDDGASRDRLRPITHGLGSSVMEMYDTPAWAACCEQVLKLDFPWPTSEAIARPS